MAQQVKKALPPPPKSIPRTHREEEREMTPSHVFDMSAHTISGRKVGLVGE